MSIPVGMDRGNVTVQAFTTEATEKLAETIAKQQESKEDLKAEQEGMTIPVRPGTLERIKGEATKITRTEKAKEAGEPPPIEGVAEKADDFAQEHSEHKKQDLVALHQSLDVKDKSHEILNKVKTYSNSLTGTKDPIIIKEALEFLILSTKGDLKNEIVKALNEFVEAPDIKSALAIGSDKNIAEITKAVAKDGTGTPTEFRSAVQETLNIKDSNTFYQDFKRKYPSFEEREKAVKMLFHILGNDTKSQTKPDDHIKLADLISQIKAIQGSYRVEVHFKENDRRIDGEFARARSENGG